MDDIPDIYADNLSVTVSPVSVTITLARAYPTIDPVTAEAGGLTTRQVAHVRMSRQLALQLSEILRQSLAQTASETAQITTSGPKH